MSSSAAKVLVFRASGVVRLCGAAHHQRFSRGPSRAALFSTCRHSRQDLVTNEAEPAAEEVGILDAAQRSGGSVKNESDNSPVRPRKLVSTLRKTRTLPKTSPVSKKGNTLLQDFGLERSAPDAFDRRELKIAARKAYYEPDSNNTYPSVDMPTNLDVDKIHLDNVFLRDHCQCDKCVHPVTKQRLFDTFEGSTPLYKHKRFQLQSATIETGSISVIWRDGHRSVYSINWLERAFHPSRTVWARTGQAKPADWNDAKIKSEPPKVDFEAVMNSEQGVAEWTKKIRELGFCFVEGCPATPEATQALLERIGPIRNTHYGAFYDFTSDLSSKDTAYTSMALDVHTDTTYFTEPAGLQMFHMLSHTEGEGGETQLVDGFRAAAYLRKKLPDYYNTLSTVKMMAHASGNDGISIQPSQPFSVFVHDETINKMVQVRWNNSDRGAFVLDGAQHTMQADWYLAASKWSELLKSKKAYWHYEFKLEPGMPLIFDNWRVLHGRSAFTGKRRMAGGYVNHDDFISRYKTTNFGYDHVLKTGIY